MQLATANPSPVCHFPNACPRSSAANTAMRWSTVISSDIFDLLSTAYLRTTAVMHEAFLRMVGIEIEWRDRAHFLAKLPPGSCGGCWDRAEAPTAAELEHHTSHAVLAYLHGCARFATRAVNAGASVETTECRGSPASRRLSRWGGAQPVDDEVSAARPTHRRVCLSSGRRCRCCSWRCIPDSVKVKAGIGAEDVVGHPPDFRRASDLRCSLARASAGSMRWPRSSESNRRPSSRLNSASWPALAWSCSSRSRRASLTTSLAELRRPDSTLVPTNFSSSGVREEFMSITLAFITKIVILENPELLKPRSNATPSNSARR